MLTARFRKLSFDIFIYHIDSDIGLVWINLHVRMFQEALQFVERLRANIFSLKINSSQITLSRSP